MRNSGWRVIAAIGLIVMLGVAAVGIVQAQDQSASPAASAAASPGASSQPSPEASPGKERHGRLRDRFLDGALPWMGRLGERGPFGHGFKRMGRLDALVHAEAVIDVPDKGLTRYTADVGDVTAVGSDGKVTIARKDGQSVTLSTNADTKVRKDREKIEASGLAVGDHVFALAVDESGTLTARTIVVFTAREPVAPPAAAPSPSG
jgi:hypothetical protein